MRANHVFVMSTGEHPASEQTSVRRRFVTNRSVDTGRDSDGKGCLQFARSIMVTPHF